MAAPNGRAVDPGTTRRPGMAAALGVALFVAMMVAALAAVDYDRATHAGGYVLFVTLGAAGLCARALFLAVQLGRGRTRTWHAVAWFFAACLGLLFLILVSALTYLGDH